MLNVGILTAEIALILQIYNILRIYFKIKKPVCGTFSLDLSDMINKFFLNRMTHVICIEVYRLKILLFVLKSG